ncbi:hypothetical protein BT63DRAFT_424396 [Microthyrium microscopicum]|uniref:HECT-type E3 ubiquitin transferase n=1 Tax=Microthyrium microscopicum TaxID=703497 RepID=A0A6A6UF79_9PEZI|nr:hypothetical protein BT63DRAFT_424396 [Microthyrium microscopicum]
MLESRPVTGSNIDEYVLQYTRNLVVQTVRGPLSAFAVGFHTILDKTTLSVISPSQLQRVAEGAGEITEDQMDKVRAFAKYDHPYHREHKVIQWFWQSVRGYGVERRKALLGFITGNERMPVSGLTIISIIKMGDDSEMLPTSSTCFSKLSLPEYSSKEKLEAKLAMALEHSIGFGVA